MWDVVGSVLREFYFVSLIVGLNFVPDASWVIVRHRSGDCGAWYHVACMVFMISWRTFIDVELCVERQPT